MNRLNSTATTRISSGVQTILIRVGFAVLFLVQTVAFGQWTEPVLMRPPINVDPPGSYYYSTISADGQVLCMTIYQGAPNDDDVYISERIDDSTWTTPVNAGPNVNNEGRNLSPSITSDRQRLYFVSYHEGSYDIFVSHRTGPDWDDWSPKEQLPEPINRGREFTGQISFDDSTLVFTSTGQPGMHEGGDAAFTSRLQPDGSWSEPEEIAFHLYDPSGFVSPCLTMNGEVFVYGQRWGHNNPEILYAMRTDSGFSAAIRCDSTINTEWWDSGPSCPADGSILILDSRRNPPNGAARLYEARRVFTNTDEPSRGSSPIPTIRVSPSFGSFGTVFEIALPSRLAGSEIRIYNISGQIIESLQANRQDQTIFSWKGGNYAKVNLSSGIYFIHARNKTQSGVGKVLLLR
ncbi:MAG: PD40 domain-containing protein [bacterium]|nr:PD40 domain-containing protein [bacterium]